jgi:hypothetical protein
VAIRLEASSLSPQLQVVCQCAPTHRAVGLQHTVVCEDGGAHLRALRLSIHSEEQPDDAPAVAQWGEAVCMRALQLPRERQEQHDKASAFAQWGEAVCMRALQLPRER